MAVFSEQLASCCLLFLIYDSGFFSRCLSQCSRSACPNIVWELYRVSRSSHSIYYREQSQPVGKNNDPNFNSSSLSFALMQKNQPACRQAGRSRLIFRSLKTTQTPYPADSKPLRLCIPLVTLVGYRPPLPTAAAPACFTTALKSRPVSQIKNVNSIL